MSKKEAIYQAYLEKWRNAHPGIEQPVFCGGFSGVPIPSLEGAIEKNATGKCLRGMDVRVYILPDGRAIETGWMSSGRFPIAYVFPSDEARKNYDAPMSMSVYFETW